MRGERSGHKAVNVRVCVNVYTLRFIAHITPSPLSLPTYSLSQAKRPQVLHRADIKPGEIDLPLPLSSADTFVGGSH